MSTVVIKPKSGSKKFYKNAKQFQRVIDPTTKQPTGEYTEAGEYQGERFPNSLQKPRIKYSFKNRRWEILKDNGVPFTNEELNALVSKCHLTYWKGPNKGKYIKEAEVTNFSDPFFNHPELSIRLNEGSTTLNSERGAFDKLMIAGLRGNRTFKEANKASGPIGATNVKYIITDKNSDIKQASDSRNRMIEAVKKFEALNDEQRRILARIMGLGIRDATDRALVDDTLFKAATDDKSQALDGNISKQQMFFQLCELDSDELAFRDLIARARTANIIRKTREGYQFRGQKIGRTTKSIEVFFKDYDHQEMLLSLEQALEDQTAKA